MPFSFSLQYAKRYQTIRLSASGCLLRSWTDPAWVFYGDKLWAGEAAIVDLSVIWNFGDF